MMADRNGDAIRHDRDRFIGFAFASADLLLELTGDLRVSWAGGAALSLLGLESDRAIGLPLADLISPLDAALADAAIRGLKAGGRCKDLLLTLRRGDGGATAANVSVYQSLNKQQVQYFLAIARRNLPVSDAAAQPRRDRATGLVEAVEFAQTTASALRSAREAGQSARLILVQICGEGELDRLLGAERSKALLSEIGAQLRKHAVVPEAAAKLGDGRFSVAQLGGAAPEAISTMIAEIGESFALDPADLQVTEASVDFEGQSLAESDVESILGHVLERFRAEGAGGVTTGSAEAFLRKMMAETVSRVVMMRDLIHERRLTLHYQPIVALTDRKAHHYEVLLRFPDGRSPFEDIQFAEQINTIHEVDLAVTRGAIARLQEAEANHQDLSLAVNMSARSLLNDTFLSMFETLADKVGGKREKLIIEITESAKLEDLAKAAQAVARLSARGHPICLDDFGAGASSLPYLQRLIVGYVKIDGTYVRGIHDHLRERAIIEGVLATCSSLGVLTVAEMVEKEDEHKILQDLGVTLGQGWLYGRPAPQITPSAGPATVRVPRKLDPAKIGRLLTKNAP
jgi:EAL domain-containing protein (putative c-di-GMP-specific phosphodiesterase class I)/PAS domain-containing protein